MLTDASGDVPRIRAHHGNIEVEAVSVDDAARVAGVGRTSLYKAMNPDPDRRERFPYLSSIKVGRARRIRLSTLRAWLAALEVASDQDAA